MPSASYRALSPWRFAVSGVAIDNANVMTVVRGHNVPDATMMDSELGPQRMRAALICALLECTPVHRAHGFGASPGGGGGTPTTGHC